MSLPFNRKININQKSCFSNTEDENIKTIIDNWKNTYVNGERTKLRCGYTTGTCAAAAATAATYVLFNKKNLEYVVVYTPKGIEVPVRVNSIEKGKDYVVASVIKDAGDDSDITDGIEIFAKVSKSKEEFNLTAGLGVGLVTQDGLSVKKGEYAINPVPREMIKRSVLNVLEEGQGVNVEISVPAGVEIAKKTFNPRLGIEGGISILGTTGIVYPMSEEALKESIRVEINQKSINNEKLVLVFGNIGERCALDLGFSREQIVIISNFVGFALQCVCMKNIKEVLIIGHIGKISKVAYGCFNTHSRVSDIRLEVIALELALMGKSTDFIKNVMAEKTSEGAVKFLGEGYEELYQNIGCKIVNKMSLYTYGEVKCDAIMYSGYSNYEILYSSLDNC